MLSEHCNKCPLCGSRVTYQGLVNMECAGSECPNASRGAAPRGTYLWALEQERLGRQVAFYDGRGRFDAVPSAAPWLAQFDYLRWVIVNL